MNLKIPKYFTVLILFLFLSCDETINDTLMVNQPPETHLFLYSDFELSQQKSKLKVHWWGDDKDGLVVGFFFKWEGIDDTWTFISSNDSVFALPIGTVDTSFTFLIAAIDNAGNGDYDEKVFLNGVEIGSEPFTDINLNGNYDSGEPFIDLGAIDESPASQKFPIKNSAPEIIWSKASILPEKSFPSITIGWDAFDLDGNETITEIHLALNDTSNYIVLKGSTRLVSLIIDNLESESPSMNVFINGDNNKKNSDKLANLKLDSFNKFFIRGLDNSGASSKFISLPDTGSSWFVSKPQGDLLIIDDYDGGEQVSDFYDSKFNTFSEGKFDILDIENTILPYESITFRNTIKLFKFIFWYADANPSLELTNLITQNYLQNSGKIAYSMTFQDSSSTFEFSTQLAQTFLPIESFDSKESLPFMFSGSIIVPSSNFENYPTLETETTIGFVRTFKVSEITSTKTHDLTSSQINGEISLLNNTKNLFFIGLPLHQCDARDNVSELLQQIFVEEFGMNK